MDLPSIGIHCSLDSCHELDFLPIICPSCNEPFCRFHVQRDAHACPVDPAEIAGEPRQEPTKFDRCALSTCSKPSLEAYVGPSKLETERSSARCPACRKSFCAHHRDPESHSCVAPIPVEPVKNVAARQLLAKHFPPVTTSRPSRATNPVKTVTTTDPKKLNALRKVEAMRMRHRAVPLDLKTSNVTPLEQRLHVKARPSIDGNDKCFWVLKSIGGGRALDLLAAELGISYSDSSPVRLLKFSSDADEWIVLRNDQALEGQVEDGATLAVVRSDNSQNPP